MQVAVIITAAGRSQRFGDADKLAQDFGGRPLLFRSVETFAKHTAVRAIIVAGPPDGYDDFRERYAATLGFHGAVVVRGGAIDRWETVRHALAAVPDDATHVAVHDAARPLLSGTLLTRLLDAAASRPAVVPVMPVDATIKRLGPEETVESTDEADVLADAILGDAGRSVPTVRRVVETVDRTDLCTAQTPQVFTVELIRRAYDQDCTGATDDASLVERLGEPVFTVPGDVRNMKITTREDLELARRLI